MPLSVGYIPGTDPTDPLYPAPIYTPRPGAGSDWAFAAGDWRNEPDTLLSQITGRSVTFRLTGQHEAGFTLDGLSPQAASIDELVTDLWVAYKGNPLFRGRIGASSDAADDKSMTSTFSAASYLTLLARRLLGDADRLTAWAGWDPADLAWSLLAAAQAKPGGDLGIVQGFGRLTGTDLPAQVFTVGTTLLDVLNLVTAGFDIGVAPIRGSTTQTFDCYYPSRGTDRGKMLNYPGDVAGFNRTVDPGAFANAIRVSGASTLKPITEESASITVDAPGRFESSFGDNALATAAALQAAADVRLAAAQLVTPVWVVTLHPDTWGGPEDVWLGDPATLAVNFGRLNVLATMRVYEIKITFSDTSDSVTAELTLGGPKPSNRWLLRRFDARLTSLENR